MIRKILLSAAIAGQIVAGAAYAAPVRPQAVRLVSGKPIAAIGVPVRAIGRADKGNELALGLPLPLLILAGVVVIVGVVAVASGGDSNSSPN